MMLPPASQCPQATISRAALQDGRAVAFGCGGSIALTALVGWCVQMRLQPDEAIYMKIVVKKPGLEMDTTVSEMDLSYKQRYQGAYIPDAYERLILDAIRGDQQHFVRRCPILPLSLPLCQGK